MGEYRKFFEKVADSSEMICSLRYEDVHGCPYNTFTPRSIAALASASSFFAIVSLIVGI